MISLKRGIPDEVCLPPHRWYHLLLIGSFIRQLVRQEIIDSIDSAASDAEDRQRILARLSVRNLPAFSERQIRPYLAPMLESAISSAGIDDGDLTAFRCEHGEMEQQLFVNQVKGRLFEIFDKFYGILVPDISVSSVAELAMHSVHLLSKAISSNGVKRISRSHKDFLQGDLAVTKKARDSVGQGVLVRIKELENRVGETECVVETSPRDRLECKAFASYMPDELTSVFPLILSRYKRNPGEAAGRVVGKLLRIIYREMLEQKVESELLDRIVASGMIVEDRYNEGSYIINLQEKYRLGNPVLSAAYANPSLYSSPDMFSPPSERQPYVLRLEYALGCDYNRCTYCGGYKGVKYHVRSVKEFERHFRDVVAELEWDRDFVERIFIGDGNALAANTDDLVEVLDLVRRYLPNSRRISMFGRADTIVKKGVDGLRRLKEHGLDLLYVGAESGCQDVLDYVKKRASGSDIRKAAEMMMAAGIDLSIMIMPGLGGARFVHEHAKQSADLLNEVAPRFVTLMCINADHDSEYARRMEEEVRQGVNRPLTDKEVVRQLREMIVRMIPRESMKVGMYDRGIDQVACNPVSFNVQFDHSGKQEIIDICDCFSV